MLNCFQFWCILQLYLSAANLDQQRCIVLMWINNENQIWQVFQGEKKESKQTWYWCINNLRGFNCKNEPTKPTSQASNWYSTESSEGLGNIDTDIRYFYRSLYEWYNSNIPQTSWLRSLCEIDSTICEKGLCTQLSHGDPFNLFHPLLLLFVFLVTAQC